ncbi:MAG: hypothetical protein K0R28_7153 [Paenibacillus sp.]|nr:hypothetical protein [Paenibacillus sp.]
MPHYKSPITVLFAKYMPADLFDLRSRPYPGRCSGLRVEIIHGFAGRIPAVDRVANRPIRGIARSQPYLSVRYGRKSSRLENDARNGIRKRSAPDPVQNDRRDGYLSRIRLAPRFPVHRFRPGAQFFVAFHSMSFVFGPTTPSTFIPNLY